MRPAIAAGSPARSTTRVPAKSASVIVPLVDLTLVSDYCDARRPEPSLAREESGMPKYRIVDADCHILEPPDIWQNWLPEGYQDKAPKLVKDAEGGDDEIGRASCRERV